MIIRKIGAKSLALLGVVWVLSVSLLFQEVLPLLSAMMVAFIVLAIASSFSQGSKNGQLTIDKSILAAALPIFGVAAISLAHFDISETLYLMASVAALYAGYVYVPPPSKSFLAIKGVPFFLFLISAFYALGEKNEGAVLTSNFSGSIFLVCIPFWYAICNPKPTQTMLWLMTAILVLPTFTRSILLGLLIGVVIVYYSFKSKTRSIWSIGFFFVCAIFYLKFQDEISAIYQSLDLLSYTGKNLDTGRAEMWRGILGSMSTYDFLLGGVDLKNVNELVSPDGKILSAHNGYLSILASVGLLGVFFALLIPVTIISVTFEKNSPGSKILAVYVIVFFVREFFEVSLHGNNFPIAGAFWFGVGLLMKLTVDEKAKLKILKNKQTQ